MKSLMKKVFAAAAAIATVFGLAATTVATANAADNATLTVSTTDAKFAGKTVNAYKMFSATVSGDGKAVSYTLTDAWKPFFKDSTASGLTGATDTDVNDKANKYVSKLLVMTCCFRYQGIELGTEEQHHGCDHYGIYRCHGR